MNHATQLFPIALQELLEIGEKGMKQREQRERVKHVASKEKQLKLKLTTTL
jgi:hypothetical protein